MRTQTTAALVAALVIAGCGGGGGPGPQGPTAGTQPPTTTPPAAARLPFPLEPWRGSLRDDDSEVTWTPAAFPDGAMHYGAGEVPAVAAADAGRPPTYHDAPLRGLRALGDPVRRHFVGVDQVLGAGDLPVVGERGGSEVRHGRVSDGPGAAAMSRYLAATVDDPALRWRTAPVVRFGGGTGRDYERVIRAVQLVNAALPERVRMTVAQDGPSGDPGTGIYVEFVPERDFPGRHWGVTHNSNSGAGNQITHSRITVNEAYANHGDRQATILVAHELIHALGVFGGADGHVPDDLEVGSIMGRHSTLYWVRQWGELQPASLLWPADREALRLLYDRLAPGDPCRCSPSDLGPWSDESLHVHGNGPHAGFGVALRNGRAEPWAYGYLPDGDLSGAGVATWNGTLLGLTPQVEAVAGDASLRVDLGTMRGTAEFTALEHWAAGAAPGAARSGATWGDGDLRYAVSVEGNTFREAGGDEGRLTGIFTGRAHEGAAGTLERDDLTAAFGAARE